MNVPAITQREALTGLALPLAAVFVVAVGYGVVLPVLPFVLARALGEAASTGIAWHTGLLTGVYMFTLFVFAPMWGYVSDRIGRRPVILLDLAGFSVTMVLFGLAENLTIAYFARVLGGLFSAAVLPVTLAYAGDANALAHRARGFAWLSAATALGSLAGPSLAGWLSNVRLPIAITGNMAQADSLTIASQARTIHDFARYGGRFGIFGTLRLREREFTHGGVWYHGGCYDLGLS